MELWQQQALFAKNLSKLITFIYDKGFYCTLSEVYRYRAENDHIAKYGKAFLNEIHQERLAADINLFTKGGQYQAKLEIYEPFGLYWERIGHLYKWGGSIDNGDPNHFQMTR